MRVLKFIGKRALVFAMVIIALWAALFAAACIPNEKIKENMSESALYYGSKLPFEYSKLKLTEDNYADSILLNVVWNMGVGDPFTASLDTKYFDGYYDDTDYGENIGLCMTILGEEPNTDYTRYWHGMAVFIRPLMLLTDVKGIKLIGMISALVLLAGNCALLAKKRQYFASAALAGAMFCVNIWDIRLSMEYQPAVIVTLALLPLYILLEERGDGVLSLLCVISGAVIAFFDFLTAETLSLLIPLAVVAIMRKHDKRLGTLKQNAIIGIQCGACWGLSYAGAFLVKWTAASIVTGENKFAAALSSAEVRFAGSAENLSPIKQFFLAPLANISTLFGGSERVSAANIVGGLALTLLACVVVFYLFYSRERLDKVFLTTMAVIGAVPFVRFFLLNNHSYLHEFFTYRALAATILALAAMLASTLEFRPKKKKAEKGSGGRK